MIRSRFLAASLAVMTLPLCAAAAAAQTPPPTTGPPPATVTSPPTTRRLVEGTVSVGILTSDSTGNPQRVGQYDDIFDTTRARTGFELWGQNGRVKFDLAASHGGDRSDQRYSADVAIGRMVKAHVQYQRSPKRLDHDPLTYVDAASNIGGTFVVEHTDTDPFAEYGFDYAELVSRLEVVLPKAPFLRFYVSHRQETRSGSRQSLVTSHCATCHVVSYSREMDQKTSDLIAGMRLSTARVSVDYQYQNRRFDENGGGLTHTYDRAVHPVTLAEVFLNRVQFDQRDGPLPFDTMPSIETRRHALRAAATLPGEIRTTGSFTSTRTRNLDTNLQTRQLGGVGRFVVPLGARVSLRGSARRYTIESDSVAIDVIELVSPAGPSAGRTYAQAYPTFGNPDYVRESSLSRTPTDMSLELSWKPFKNTTMRAGYVWEEIRRDHFAVNRTTTQSLLLSGRGTLAKGLQWRSRFDYDWTRDPFLNERAALPAVLQPTPSPGSLPFTGLQYYQMYGARQADLTSFPTRHGSFDQTVTWTPAQAVSISGHYRWHGASNDDLTFSTWERTSHAPGVEFWIAPSEHWSLMAGYTYQKETLETYLYTLAFSG